MPEISRFFGMILTMYYADHPPPHFHVRYGSAQALVSIDPLAIIEGDLPPRLLGMVMEWAALHRTELMDNWRQASRNQPLAKIPPLE